MASTKLIPYKFFYLLVPQKKFIRKKDISIESNQLIKP